MEEYERNTSTPDQDLLLRVGEWVDVQMTEIESAAKLIQGDEATVEDVFPLPPEERDTADTPEWTTEQISIARNVAHRLGYGAESDVSSGAHRSRVLIEGGLVWKIDAETEAADNEDVFEYVYCGTPHRKLRADEREYITRKIEGLSLIIDSADHDDLAEAQRFRDALVELLDNEGATEYDYAALRATQKVALGPRDGEDLSLGYTIISENQVTLSFGSNGQFKNMGYTADGRAVHLLRVDRENHVDSSGELKFQQPNPAALMGFIVDISRAQGRHDPVVFITSNTYASRVPAAVLAGLLSNHYCAVGMYGRETLARVKGTALQEDTPLNQLPGDIGVYYAQLKQIRATLDQRLGPRDV